MTLGVALIVLAIVGWFVLPTLPGVQAIDAPHRAAVEARVLAALAEGYEFTMDIARTTRLQYHQVFVALYDLEERGVVTSDWETPRQLHRRPRRAYRLVHPTETPDQWA